MVYCEGDSAADDVVLAHSLRASLRLSVDGEELEERALSPGAVDRLMDGECLVQQLAVPRKKRRVGSSGSDGDGDSSDATAACEPDAEPEPFACVDHDDHDDDDDDAGEDDGADALIAELGDGTWHVDDDEDANEVVSALRAVAASQEKRLLRADSCSSTFSLASSSGGGDASDAAGAAADAASVVTNVCTCGRFAPGDEPHSAATDYLDMHVRFAINVRVAAVETVDGHTRFTLRVRDSETQRAWEVRKSSGEMVEFYHQVKKLSLEDAPVKRALWGSLRALRRFHLPTSLFHSRGALQQQRKLVFDSFLQQTAALVAPAPLGPRRRRALLLLQTFCGVHRHCEVFERAPCRCIVVAPSLRLEADAAQLVAEIFAAPQHAVQLECERFAAALTRSSQDARHSRLTPRKARTILKAVARKTAELKRAMIGDDTLRRQLASTTAPAACRSSDDINNATSDEAREEFLEEVRHAAGAFVEQRVFVLLEDHVHEALYTLWPHDAELRLRHKLRVMQTKDQRYFGVPDRLASPNDWADARRELRRLNDFALPLDKLKCIVRSASAVFRSCARCAGSLSSVEQFAPSITTDEFIAIHLFVVVNSGATNLLATRELLRLMCDYQDATGEIGAADEPGSWVTELVCFLFNAQGEVLQIARGDPGASTAASTTRSRSRASPSGDGYFGARGNLLVRRQRAKDAAERELVAFSLAKLHPFVEVVGCLATYAEDEIARSPRLNEFLWTCDLSSSSSGAEGDARYHGEKPRRAFEYAHDPRARAGAGAGAATANVVVLCKFYRNPRSRGEWLFHALGEPAAVRSAIVPALAEAMQVFLLDIIPELEIPNRNALTSVGAVCAALSFDEFLGIEARFPAAGVRKDDFARLVLRALVHARPELQHAARAAALVALLFEMFEQIDINGDARVDWEEFTTFCISIGLIATSDQELGGAANLHAPSYRQVPVGGGAVKARSFPYQIARIKSFTQLKRIAVVENKSAVVLMYDADLVLQHEMSGVEKLLGKDSEPAVLDVEHVAARNLLAISSSDHAITLWAIVNLATGAYVFASKIVNRFPVAQLKWCGPLRRLLAAGAEHAQLWDIDAQRVDARLGHHRDRVTDYAELGATGYFATCSFDRTIAVWEVATRRVAFVLEGHAQGVLALDYAQNTLLSSGFEYRAYCWSVSTRTLLVTLSGHQHRLIGAKFVSGRTAAGAAAAGTALAVTGDESGRFKLWDLSRCVRGSTSDLATLLQSFELRTANLCRLSTFSCGVAAPSASASGDAARKLKSAETELADIVVGNLQLCRFRALAHADESAPPHHVVYNAVANTFVGSVDGCITVWSAHSGVKVEAPIHIRDAEVCGIVFDVPRERKLFIATSDGCIRLYNPITGMLMTKSQIHDGVISSLLFCPRTCCLISTGYDRNICISHSTAGKTDVEVLRTVENAHESCITACAFSADLDLVATGDDSGCVQVYDFQKLYLLFRCESHRHEVRALHFHVQAPLLISGDSSGVVYVWQATGAGYTAAPLMRLALHDSAGPTASPLSSPITPHNSRPQQQQVSSPVTPQGQALSKQHVSNAPPITAICSTPETADCAKPLVLAACENGEVHAWDFRVLVSAARQRATGIHFAYQPPPPLQSADETLRSEGYNPLLRVAHKQSVLKLRPEDRNGGRSGLASSPLRRVGEHQHQPTASVHSGVPICASSLSWSAHDDAVFVLKRVPEPGMVFTASQDGKIRVWDASRECIGEISTLEAAPESRQSRHSTPGAQRASASSQSAGQPNDASTAWKFTHHPSSDASQQHARIAAEVLRKHARAKKRAQKRQTAAAAHSKAMVEKSCDAGALSELPAANSKSKTQPSGGVAALLANQQPFSDSSVRAGVQQGLFGPHESRQLKEIAHSPALVASFASKGALSLDALPPTPATTKKTRAARVAGPLSAAQWREMSSMRTMTNFPRELQRRSATRSTAAAQALDVALSPFLLEKLPESGGGARSTPKRKLQMRVDASVMVLRNVSMPKLPALPVAIASEAPVACEDDADRQATSTTALKACASAPVLSGSSHAAGFASGPEEQPKRSNIERKLKLYEDITGMPESSRLARATKRHSQPAIMTRHVSAVGGLAQHPFGPFYTAKQVIEFGNIITRFDEDFSGDIDQHEWVAMLQSFRPIFGLSDMEATEKLFRSLDRDDSGRIGLHEILPAMFSKATPEQLQKMKAFIRAHTDDKAAKRRLALPPEPPATT
ncbi:hypothetical protein PybrP1_006794 [[Pythium] brassicae (nom. inval.)]|nr:hypothetical protein PybrP1_006794 [[Pythium] brassicae (nom. inval.)]